MAIIKAVPMSRLIISVDVFFCFVGTDIEHGIRILVVGFCWIVFHANYPIDVFGITKLVQLAKRLGMLACNLNQGFCCSRICGPAPIPVAYERPYPFIASFNLLKVDAGRLSNFDFVYYQ